MRKKDEIIKSILTNLVSAEKIEGYAYDHFRQSEAVPTPFAVYRRVAPDNVPADDVVYHRGDNVDLEIYADTPEDMAELMDAVEEMLTEAGLYFRIAADTAYIESEDFYETLYET